MSNYHNKYLKYKKKYIDLKNSYEESNLQELDGGFYSFLNSSKSDDGGDGNHLIFFYDKENKLVAETFTKIKEDYKKHLANTNINLNKPYVFKINLKKDLNALLNVFTYKIGDNKVLPYFTFGAENICLEENCQSNTSKRMKHLVAPFNKAIRLYKKTSILPFLDEKKLIITSIPTCNNLELQANQILKFINGRINSENRSNSTKSLLQLVKLYQELTIQEIVQYQLNRIGGYSDLLGTLTNPSGTTAETKIEKLEEKTPEEKQKLISSELKNYLREDVVQLGQFSLKIDLITFNNVTDMIYLKIRGDGKAELLNIFETQTSQNVLS